MVGVLRSIVRWLLKPVPFGIGVWFALGFLLRRILPPVTCRDGWPSPSIGLRGACSHHGGVDGGLQALAMLLVFALSIAAGIWRHTQIEKAQRRKYEQPPGAPDPPALKGPGNSTAVFCPRCHAHMRRRLAQRGRNKGNYFWGCSRYPKCKGTRDIPATTP